MIVEIALCVGAAAFVVLVGVLIPLLRQLTTSVAESERVLVLMNAELPLFLKEMRAAAENLNALVEHARSGVTHATVLLHAAGALGDTVQWVQKAVRGTRRSWLSTLTGIVAGVKAMTAVVRSGFLQGKRIIRG